MSKRFLFDNRDFDQIAEAAAVPAGERPQFTQMDLDAATMGAQQRGFEEGLANATQSLEAQIVRLMESVGQRMNEMRDAEMLRARESQALAIDVAMGLVRKIMPELANQQSLEGISALVKQVMMDRFEEPRLIIRVHDSVLDSLSARLEKLAAQSGFRGQYALMADTALAPNDCRIEWSNGGVERSAARLWDNMQITLAQIQAAISPDYDKPPIAPAKTIQAEDTVNETEPQPTPNESDAS